MIRGSVAVIVGLTVWMICATALDILLRHTLAGYAAAEPQLQFTLTMMVARLALPGAIPSIAAGFASAWVSRGSRLATAALTVILIAVFLPAHYRLWATFPGWSHDVLRLARRSDLARRKASGLARRCPPGESAGVRFGAAAIGRRSA